MEDIARILKHGGIGVMPTDTIYGLVGSALKKKTVERIYHVRKRNKEKPMIILISSLRNLAHLGVRIDARTKKILLRLWPGKVSVILPCTSKKFAYLHRDARSLAFRFPKKKSLRNLLAQTGPLVAPSANREGKLPATTIREAKLYFDKKIDFYLDGGKIDGKPSRLIRIVDHGVERIR